MKANKERVKDFDWELGSLAIIKAKLDILKSNIS